MVNTMQYVALGNYGIALCLFLGNLITGKRNLAYFAFYITLFAFIIHLGSAILYFVSHGRLPMTTSGEIASLVALLLIGIFLELHRRIRQLDGIGFLITLLTFFVLLSSIVVSNNSSYIHYPYLSGIWFRLHTIALFVSYSLFAVAFSTALTYLIQESFLKHKTVSKIAIRLPSLNMLDKITNNLVILAFPLLTSGLVAGFLWAGQIWERYWEWEPKQILALLTWLVYAFYMIVRTVAGWKGRRIILLNIIGFLLILITFFGVSYFMPGKHNFI